MNFKSYTPHHSKYEPFITRDSEKPLDIYICNTKKVRLEIYTKESWIIYTIAKGFTARANPIQLLDPSYRTSESELDRRIKWNSIFWSTVTFQIMIDFSYFCRYSII